MTKLQKLAAMVIAEFLEKNLVDYFRLEKWEGYHTITLIKHGKQIKSLAYSIGDAELDSSAEYYLQFLVERIKEQWEKG
jgi:hypothetical protein